MKKLSFTGRSIVGALMVMGLSAAPALAQADHMHGSAAPRQLTPAEQAQASALVAAVREATAQYKDGQLDGTGYKLMFGCVTGSDQGAMGMHFVNASLAFDGGELDINKPEILLYEPLPGGKLRLTGADYLVVASDWDAKHDTPPMLDGQLFHYFEAPNRFKLPAFYTLHVWAWKENPAGTFTNWNPNVSCDAFNGQN